MHIITVGWAPILVCNLWDRIQLKGNYRISHIAHPTFTQASWEIEASTRNVSFFRDDWRTKMPTPNRQLLASLEMTGVPTIHNMILSDHVVSKLPYEESLAYATFLTQKLITFYNSLNPTVVIGGFDGLHGSLGFAVAKRLEIPWFALNFNSLPRGHVALCSDLSPASKVTLEPRRAESMRSTADRLLKEFEDREIEAAAYIPPKLFTAAFIFRRIPGQLRALARIAQRRMMKNFFKYTQPPAGYSIVKLIREAVRLRKNVLRLPHHDLLREPLDGRYAFFGLHMQPESSIDVFAHFFSNQISVIELMARSLPPTHTLLVKLHKSDVPNYSRAQLANFARLPGVRLVSPYADTFEFIRRADLIFSIQGTIGLEGALLGKPVIMFGESPTRIFPSVSTVGRNPDLPDLVRQKFAEASPARAAIIDAFAVYLAAFYSASCNDWTIRPTDGEIDGYVHLFTLLESYLRSDECSLRRANQ